MEDLIDTCGGHHLKKCEKIIGGLHEVGNNHYTYRLFKWQKNPMHTTNNYFVASIIPK